jgi:hypothetical protein
MIVSLPMTRPPAPPRYENSPKATFASIFIYSPILLNDVDMINCENAPILTLSAIDNFPLPSALQLTLSPIVTLVPIYILFLLKTLTDLPKKILLIRLFMARNLSPRTNEKNLFTNNVIITEVGIDLSNLKLLFLVFII